MLDNKQRSLIENVLNDILVHDSCTPEDSLSMFMNKIKSAENTLILQSFDLSVDGNFNLQVRDKNNHRILEEFKFPTLLLG